MLYIDAREQKSGAPTVHLYHRLYVTAQQTANKSVLQDFKAADTFRGRSTCPAAVC